MSVQQAHLTGHLSLDRANIDGSIPLQRALRPNLSHLSKSLPFSQMIKHQTLKSVLILLALLDSLSIQGQPLLSLHSKYILCPTMHDAKFDPWVKVSAKFCHCKGSFSYLKLKSHLLNVPLRLRECSVSLAFYPMILKSVSELCLN